MDEVHRDSLHAKFLDIGEAGDGTGGVFIVSDARIARTCTVDAFVERREDFRGLEGGHIEEAAPDFGGGEATGHKPRDNTEIVGATFKGAPEIGIG